MARPKIIGLQVHPEYEQWAVSHMSQEGLGGVIERFDYKQEAIEAAKEYAESDGWPGVVVSDRNWQPQRVWLNYDTLKDPRAWAIGE